MSLRPEEAARLLRAEQETLRALDAVLMRVDDATVVDELRVFRREHAGHVQALGRALEEAGPAAGGETPAPLSDELLRSLQAASPAESLGALAAAESASAALFAQAASAAEPSLAELLEDVRGDHERNALVLRRAAESAQGVPPAGPA